MILIRFYKIEIFNITKVILTQENGKDKKIEQNSDIDCRYA